MQSKILTSCLMAGVLITGSLASHADETNAPTQPTANGAPVHVQPLPGAATAGPMGVLSDEQRASYTKNMTDTRAEMMELTSKLRMAQQEVNEMTLSLKVDENLIRQKVMEAAKLQADMMILRAKAFAEIQPPITEEQLEKIKQAQTPNRPPIIRPSQAPPAAPAATNHDQSGMPGKQ